MLRANQQRERERMHSGCWKERGREVMEGGGMDRERRIMGLREREGGVEQNTQT